MYVVNFKIETGTALQLRDIQMLWDYLREETEGFPDVKVSYEAYRIQNIGRGETNCPTVVSL